MKSMSIKKKSNLSKMLWHTSQAKTAPFSQLNPTLLTGCTWTISKRDTRITDVKSRIDPSQQPSGAKPTNASTQQNWTNPSPHATNVQINTQTLERSFQGMAFANSTKITSHLKTATQKIAQLVNKEQWIPMLRSKRTANGLVEPASLLRLVSRQITNSLTPSPCMEP